MKIGKNSVTQWSSGRVAMSLLLLGWVTGSLGHWVAPLYAADFQISASLDRTEMALNEQVMLNVTVSGSGGSLPGPQMPGLSDFQVSNAGRAQNFSWVNGQASARVVYNYVLTPLKTGTFTIPPISLEGQSVQSSPLTLRVVEGDVAASPSASGQPARPAAARGAKGVGVGSSPARINVDP